MTIADKYKGMLNDLNSNVLIVSKNPGDTAKIFSKDLHFSGRIYIYHEDDLTLQQLGFLEGLYKANNLSIQFRGSDYVVARWLQNSK